MVGGGVRELDEGWAGKVGTAQSPAISMADPGDSVGGLAPCPEPPAMPGAFLFVPRLPLEASLLSFASAGPGGSQPPTFHSCIFMAFISGVFKTCLT